MLLTVNFIFYLILAFDYYPGSFLTVKLPESRDKIRLQASALRPIR
jgi:hypothetical protein